MLAAWPCAPVPRVPLGVLLEVGALPEELAAREAEEGLLVGMRAHVASQVAVLGEGHAAVRTLEGPLARVDAVVDLERALGGQHPEAHVALVVGLQVRHVGGDEVDLHSVPDVGARPLTPPSSHACHTQQQSVHAISQKQKLTIFRNCKT